MESLRLRFFGLVRYHQKKKSFLNGLHPHWKTCPMFPNWTPSMKKRNFRSSENIKITTNLDFTDCCQRCEKNFVNSFKFETGLNEWLWWPLQLQVLIKQHWGLKRTLPCFFNYSKWVSQSKRIHKVLRATIKFNGLNISVAISLQALNQKEPPVNSPLVQILLKFTDWMAH